VSDAVVLDALLATRNTPEALYGRRKMTHLLRRRGLNVAFCTVDRLMRDLGMSGVQRGKRPRTTIPAKDGQRAGDLLDRDFTAPGPNRVWSPTSPTCAPGPGSSTWRSSSTPSPRRSWPGTPPPTSAPAWY
jgi:transposase InsO family protein